MRILHLIQRYHPARGGAETHLREISTYLAAQGHTVTVATTDALDFELFWDPRRRRIAAAESWDEGVHIRRFPVRHLPLPRLAYPAWRRLLWTLSLARLVPVGWLARLARFTPWVPGLWRWLATTDEPFDLVAGMTICFEPISEAGLVFARRRGIPFVAYPLTHLGAGPQPAQDALSRFYTMRHQVHLVCSSDAVMTQTAAESAFFAAQGMPASRLVTAGPGVTPADVLGGVGTRFREKHQIRAPLVLMIGSMSYDKGTMHTIEAVSRLWEQGVAVELALIGTILAPFRAYWARLPQAVQERIYLLGPVDEAEKRDALDACQMLVMPSRTDSFGITYLEAWLYEKPVIGANTWGVNTVIADGEDGLLVPFGDVAALADAIRSLAAEREKTAVMGQKGRQKVLEHHTWAQKVAVSERLYRKLVNRL